jgi:hypothetical protein
MRGASDDVGDLLTIFLTIFSDMAVQLGLKLTMSLVSRLCVLVSLFSCLRFLFLGSADYLLEPLISLFCNLYGYLSALFYDRPIINMTILYVGKYA